jgi:hypothetical protein
MNLPVQQRTWLAAGLVFGLLDCRLAGAQIAANPPPTSEPAPFGRLATPTPPVKSPVGFFRELLAMSPGERRQALTNRPPDNQQGILAKVAEYEALPPDDRELRLRATELRFYLVPLLSAPAANRPAALSQIPADVRKLVESRLQQWQILPPPLQEQILADDQKLQHYLQLAGGSPRPDQQTLPPYPPDLQREIEDKGRRVDQFFGLTPEEKTEALAKLSEAERRQTEATLRIFEKLTREQRDQCIRAFGAFSRLSAEEQRQFLKNAERWQAMTPAERQEWRDLVRDVPQLPPLPPDFATSVAPDKR